MLVLVVIQVAHADRRTAAENRASADLEAALRQELERIRAGGTAPDWVPPKLPWSVMAGIWSHRLVDNTAPSVYEGRKDPATATSWFTWHQRRAPGYIVAAALLSLRDSGLIRIEVSPPGNFTNAWNRVWMERTDLGAPSGNAPAVEGGLLAAFEPLAHKRFGRTTAPNVTELVRAFIGGAQNNPFKWVENVVVQEGRRLGLYDQEARGRQPVYSITHLAACEDQVAGFVSRWKELATQEPEIVQRLVGEATLGIRSRTTSSG